MLKKFLLLLVLAVSSSVASAGPYAPPAGKPNSTAIYKDDPNFAAWASGVTVQRGYIDINNPSMGYASYGKPENALGKAEGDTTSVVSLGDGGVATLTFDRPITNGPSYDFAVFENAFNNTFLELAFVEVSSDGNHFFCFNSVSLTPTNTQVGAWGTLDATNINNLAGKYRAGYGTPFDLEELKDVNPLLDVNSVTHVRIVDVVGYVQPADFFVDGIVNFTDYSIFVAAYLSDPNDESWNRDCDIAQPADNIVDMKDLAWFVGMWLNENSYASSDSQGHQINDPWPTPFNNGSGYTGGFDLDAVGVIHQKQP
jgi:hypothetical protein